VQELSTPACCREADAATDSRRNEITGDRGGKRRPGRLLDGAGRPGDRILVCSDGLSGEVPADRLRDILAEESDPEARGDATDP
jgi:protein phosphatase